MESHYRNWLMAERRWVGAYRNHLLRPACIRYILPVFGTAVLVSIGIPFFLGAEMKEILLTGGRGLLAGAGMSLVIFFVMLWKRRKGLYIRRIRKAVDKLKLDEEEKEQLGKEMLESRGVPWRNVSFRMNGPNLRGTPARFTVTPGYAFLEGGRPYAVLIRMRDMERIRPERGRWVEDVPGRKKGSPGGKTQKKTVLYTISFQKKGKKTRGPLREESMAFFDREIRDQILEMMRKNSEAEGHEILYGKRDVQRL